MGALSRDTHSLSFVIIRVAIVGTNVDFGREHGTDNRATDGAQSDEGGGQARHVRRRWWAVSASDARRRVLDLSVHAQRARARWAWDRSRSMGCRKRERRRWMRAGSDMKERIQSRQACRTC